MHSSTIVLALVGLVAASTPPGFQPQNDNDLLVAFGSTPANNGVVVPQNAVASPPTVGTATHLSGGPYTLMMVDADVPTTLSNGSAGPPTQTLHWLQPGLYSANTTCSIGGTEGYELVNPQNFYPYGAYLQPAPPAKLPFSHRYVQLLLDTSSLPITNESALGLAGIGQRSPFNASLVIGQAGVGVVAANWFNVTNGGSAPIATNTSSAAAGASATASASSSSSSTGSSASGAPSTTAATTASSTSAGASASASAKNDVARVGLEAVGWTVMGMVGVVALL